MNRKSPINSTAATTLVILLVFWAIAVPFAIVGVNAQGQGKKILFDISHGQVGRTSRTGVYANVLGNLTAMGYSIVQARGGLNSTILQGVDFVFLGAVTGKNFSSSEIAAIKAWFNDGGKTIFVGSDSDFGKGQYIIDNSNSVLEALGSKIRVEPTQVLDPVTNAAADYRVVANIVNSDPAVAEIAAGVKRILFHGPTILAGVKDGKWVALETTTIENLYWVLKTGPDATVVDTDLIMPIAHTNGQKGSFVILAVEKFVGAKSNGKIIASGNSAGYDDYEPVFQWVYYGVSLDGPQLVKNLVTWGFKVEAPPSFLEQNLVLIAAIIVIIAIVAAAAVFLRKRKT